MKKKILKLLLVGIVSIVSLVGCGSTSSDPITDGVQTQNENAENIAMETEANEYYEAGRASLYGLDGTEINLATAYDNFEKAVELGKDDANFYLGTLYDWYSYPELDYEMAKAYYDKCENNLYADINTGFLYLYGQGVDEDKEKAKEIFQSVIDQECIEGYLGNAFIAYGEEDYDEAYDCLNKVLEEGTEQLFIASAATSMGELYFYGQKVEQDYAKALEWFEKAAVLGKSEAIDYIGYLYINGLGVEQDYAKALEWYEKAAALGDSSAIYNIGCIYMKGWGVEQDYVKALELFEQAADLGDSSAMSNAGWMYYQGWGVEKDYTKALEWCEKAVDLGDRGAVLCIGLLYFEGGFGVEQDYAKAVEWFSKAADLGHSGAINNMGWMYEKGLGVEQDYTKALEWYEKASDLGNENAMKNAERVRQYVE